jgi:hypothetical protein
MAALKSHLNPSLIPPFSKGDNFEDLNPSLKNFEKEGIGEIFDQRQ